MLKLSHGAVLDEAVGYAHAHHLHLLVVVAHPLEHSRTESARALRILDGDDALELRCDVLQERLVERFAEAHVVVGYAECAALSGKLVDSFLHIVADRSVAEHRHIVAFAYAAALADGYLLKLTMPVVATHTPAARVAYHYRTLVGQLSGVHHAAQFALVHRRAEREVGHGAQCGDVEHAVVRSAVLANQSGAVEAQYERQIEYSRVVHYVVVGALREGAVYIAERHQSVFSHSG